jgi:hypothetical protein
MVIYGRGKARVEGQEFPPLSKRDLLVVPSRHAPRNRARRAGWYCSAIPIEYRR